MLALVVLAFVVVLVLLSVGREGRWEREGSTPYDYATIADALEEDDAA